MSFTNLYYLCSRIPLDGINNIVLAICPNRTFEIPTANCARMRLIFDILNYLYGGHAIQTSA